MKKIVIGTASLLPAVAAFAEGEPSATTTPAEVAGLVTPWITNGATALITVLTAGATILGVMFIWRLVKKGLSSSK